MLVCLNLLPFMQAGSAVADDLPAAVKVEFFETHIRPILVDHCQDCHGEDDQYASLRLDHLAGFQKGSDNGPIVVPGNVEKSKLWHVLTVDREKDEAMPPGESLSAEQMAAIKQWIEQGAVWGAEADPELDLIDPSQHWAFQPVQKPKLPTGISAESDSIDHWIQSELAEKNLSMSPQADRRTLIRRLSFDLLGIPPTYDEVVAFEHDTSPDAYEKLVNQLLSRQEFGQKWGRHWLDIARYADTKGYVFTNERRFPFSYTYRDYVIEAFNNDVSYQDFVRHQLAADQYLEKDDPQLAAMGFLTVGPSFRGNNSFQIDDRIDVTMRGLMGLTVACARCHDHKFDPISMADYYGLYGVFNSSEQPDVLELPVIGEAKNPKAFEGFVKKREKIEQERADYVEKTRQKMETEVVEQAFIYFRSVLEKQEKLKPQKIESGDYQVRVRLATDLKNKLLRNSSFFPVARLWQLLSGMEEINTELVHKKLNAWEYKPKKKSLVPIANTAKDFLLTQTYEGTESLATAFTNLWQHTIKQEAEGNEQWKTFATHFRDNESPFKFTTENVSRYVYRSERNKISAIDKKYEKLLVESDGAPPRAMLMVDRESPREPVIFKRGNERMRGDRVERRFLRSIAEYSGVGTEKFQQGSGRKELAEAIIDPQNPLTARVWTNRVWKLLFGSSLVETLSDFGVRTPLPTHPELLDDLAYEFMQQNWSSKSLIRRIVLSKAYQQQSNYREEAYTANPSNSLYWKMNRKRFSFETLHDNLLAVSGELDHSHGGKSVELDGKNATTRRAVYGFIDRNNFPSLLRTFDFPSPDVSQADRPKTVVPQQALYLMNANFLRQRSEQLAKQVQEHSPQTPQQIQHITQKVFQRLPTSEEVQMMTDFLAKNENQNEQLIRLAHAMLMTNESCFVD